MKYDSDVPGTSKPTHCRAKDCENPAAHTLSATVEVFGKLVPVKFPVCEEHKPPVDKPFSLEEDSNYE